MVNEVGQSKSGSYLNLNLDWAIAEVTFNEESITIFAEHHPMPGSRKSSGYLYRAHIKRDLNETWTEELSGAERLWELQQKDNPLWEKVRNYDYNYSHRPWESRPPINRLVKILRDKGVLDIAERIKQAYKESP